MLSGSYKQEVLETSNIPIPKGPLDHNELKQQAAALELQTLERLGSLDPALERNERQIGMRGGFSHPLRIIKPVRSPTGGSPLVILLHGGGFNSGSSNDVEPYAQGIAKLFEAVVVCPTYRLAPEYPFPQGLNDAWDAFKWIAPNASLLGADPKQGFLLTGGSAGGNFVCVLAELAKDEKVEPALTGIWSCIPVLFNENVNNEKSKDFESIPEKYKRLSSSWTQNAQGVMMNQDLARIFFEWYKPDWKSPLWSPFNSPTAFKGLPRTFVHVAGKDLIRDDGIIYARALADHGVETRLAVYPGVPHAFWYAFPQLKQARELMTDIAVGVAWLFEKRREPGGG